MSRFRSADETPGAFSAVRGPSRVVVGEHNGFAVLERAAGFEDYVPPDPQQLRAVDCAPLDEYAPRPYANVGFANLKRR